MKNNFKSQILLLMILIVGVVGLTIGFASFSKSLLISSSANVTPNSDGFSVIFSSSNAEASTTEITPVKDPSTLTATSATIENGTSPKISNLGATFTNPGQKVTYSFYAYNAGQYDAYLKTLTYKNINGESVAKKCVAETGTTDSLVQSACNNISVKVKIGTEEEKGTTASFTSHPLSKGSYEAIIVTIEYGTDGNVADGDFSVNFGDIQLDYNSVD